MITNNSGSVEVTVGSVTVVPQTSTNAFRSDIARSNTSQVFLTANSSRKGATIYNDSTANLFIKFGTIATSSDFLVKLASQDYYEVPFNYTGQIDGVWATNGAGNARITELT